jgi:hypothetical protein
MSWYNPFSWLPQASGTYDPSDPNFASTAHDVKSPFTDLRENLGYGDAPKQPGVYGQSQFPSSPANLVPDPITGLYYDPVTGRTFTDPNGNNIVTNPNVAQQVANNYNEAAALRALASRGRTGQEQVFGQQTQLANNLNRTINDVNAPSVARVQLQQGLGQIQNQQLSGAAGFGGQNAFLAKRNALNTIATAGARANESAGLARAQEVQGAQNTLAGVLNTQGAGARDMYRTDMGAASDYSRLALEGQRGQQGMDATADKESRENKSNFIGDIINGGIGLFSPRGKK